MPVHTLHQAQPTGPASPLRHGLCKPAAQGLRSNGDGEDTVPDPRSEVSCPCCVIDTACVETLSAWIISLLQA